jgi:hypothetical protein
MRKGFHSLAAQVQTALSHDPYSGALYIFRGRRGDLIKILFWDRQGMCLYARSGSWPLHLAAGQRRRRVADDGAIVDAVGVDRLARHSLDGEAGSCCLNAEICAAVAIHSGTHSANRIGSRDGGSAVA